MQPGFVHLNVHSEYSLSDGIIRIDDLLKSARQSDMPAVGLSDDSNFFAAVKFYQAALRHGIKPLLGVQVRLRDANGGGGRIARPGGPGGGGAAHKLLLYCRDNHGYRALCDVLTRAYRSPQRDADKPWVDFAWLAEHGESLIALSGAQDGELGRALLDGNGAAEVAAERYLQLFGDRFYIELSRIGRDDEEQYIAAAAAFAAAKGIPLAATNAVQFLRREDFETHEIRVCVNEGRILEDRRRPRRFTEAQYLRSPKEMGEVFAGLPEALENTVEIARRCNVVFDFDSIHLPAFEGGEGGDENAAPGEMLRQKAEAGLARLLEQNPAMDAAVYRERLAMELAVINRMDYAGYFLIVADFVHWAQAHDIPVGPGRGSGAASLVSWTLGITELDPIAHGLMFERFLNPERVSLPDFDIDFCMEKRDRVIEYVAERYGADRVAQIITYGTMAARAVIHDVGRVLGHNPGFRDAIAKLVPFKPGMTLDQAMKQEASLQEKYENDSEVRDWIDKARTLEGVKRNPGRHAAGVVVAPKALTEFIPLYREKGAASMITQMDMDDLQSLGMVKIDFLGLRTLTIIDKSMKTINRARAESGEEEIELTQLPVDDARTYALINQCRTAGMFQLESSGMRELIARMKPNCFDDIVALVALFRPGPLQSGMVDDFMERKHGREKIAYLHPLMEKILLPTYGVIVYQEQVLALARALAGYTLAGADLLRKAMGKKQPEEMEKQRAVFIAGAGKNGVNEETAGEIFKLMDKFSGYGFNKAHATAYALISYRTAWLKANHPAVFMAASMSSEMQRTDKLIALRNECRNLGINIAPPDVNRSELEFYVDDSGGIVYGLGALKGVGAAAAELLIAEREANGPYAGLFDLCERSDAQKINRRALESLVKAGALDQLGAHRAACMESITAAVNAAAQKQHDKSAGQNDIFGGGGGEGGAAADDKKENRFTEAGPWSNEELLRREKEALGFYLSGHPFDAHREDLQRCLSGTLGSLRSKTDAAVTVAGMVSSARFFKDWRDGGRVALVFLEDGTGGFDVRIPEKILGERALVDSGRMLVVRGELKGGNRGGAVLRASMFMDIAAFRRACGGALVLSTTAERMASGFIADLEKLLAQRSPGECEVYIRYRDPAGTQVLLQLGEDYKLRLDPAFVDGMRSLAGEGNMQIRYDMRKFAPA